MRYKGHEIGIEIPDLTPYRHGNRGIPYVYTFRSQNPGPHVWINALTHGNEVCGAVALDRLLRSDVKPARGTISVSFANLEAYLNRDDLNPLGTRFVDEDMNRVWHKLDSDLSSVELRRARELRPLADEAAQEPLKSWVRRARPQRRQPAGRACGSSAMSLTGINMTFLDRPMSN